MESELWYLVLIPVLFAAGWWARGLDAGERERNSRRLPEAYSRGVAMLMSDRPDKEQMRADIWKYLREHDHETYVKIRRSVMGVGTHLPGKAGDRVLLSAYHIAQKVFRFN